ncbi:hypothetical protein LXL04_023418 [Taraxacum kok-saghyz]
MYVVLVMERKTETVARVEMKKRREWSVSDDIRATSGRRRKMSIDVLKGMEEAVAVRDGDLRIRSNIGISSRTRVRVSPTTCLRGIVQGDMVGVYWAARPYDAGPSELVQPGS